MIAAHIAADATKLLSVWEIASELGKIGLAIYSCSSRIWMRAILQALLIAGLAAGQASAFCIATTNNVPCGTGAPRNRQFGLLAGWIDLDQQIIVETIRQTAPLSLAGLDLQSAGKHLQPLPTMDASPFAFFVKNESKQITVANLGLVSPIESTWDTRIEYDLSAALENGSPCSDLVMVGGDSSNLRIDFCSLAGDTNFDGIVDFVDFLTLSANYGKESGAVWPDGDFDWDRAVGFSDFLALRDNFGSRLPELALLPAEIKQAANVPEPDAAWTILGCLGYVLMIVRRRCRRCISILLPC